jgi:DNA polymerase-3 subunit delta'
MSAKARASTSPVVAHPRQAEHLIGHEQAEATLRHAWDSGRLPHAWLISGPRGIGKATLAYRFAKFVLSEPPAADGGLFGDAPQDLAVSPDLPAVRQVAHGSHPDLTVLEPGRLNPDTKKPSKDIVVAQVRQAVHFCFMTPASSTWRVVIVDPADEMNANAANALLKVLEEPPRQALLLVVSHNPARLLSTIRSRCSQLALPALDNAHVTRMLSEMKPDIPGEEARAIAHLAEGSIGRALELASAGGLDLYRALLGLLSAMPNPPTSELHAFAEMLSQGGEAGTFRLGGDLLAWWLGRLARAGATGRMPEPVVPGEQDVMARLLNRAALEQWLDLWDKTTRLFAQAEQLNFDRKQVVLTLFLEIGAMTAGAPSA